MKILIFKVLYFSGKANKRGINMIIDVEFSEGISFEACIEKTKHVSNVLCSKVRFIFDGHTYLMDNANSSLVRLGKDTVNYYYI